MAKPLPFSFTALYLFHSSIQVICGALSAVIFRIHGNVVEKQIWNVMEGQILKCSGGTNMQQMKDPTNTPCWKQKWTSEYNQCVTLKIYTLWLWYNKVTRSHKIFWDLVCSDKIFWDLTRSTVIYCDLLWSHEIYWDLTTFDIFHLTFNIWNLKFEIWHLTSNLCLTFDMTWHDTLK